MFRLLWNLSIRVRLFLRTYMPTNILLDALHTRRGPKWGVPAMLIAVLYLLGAWLLTVWIADGGPDDVDRAVGAARAAFDRGWGHGSGFERAAVLRACGD